jgi:hypothetical protein
MQEHTGKSEPLNNGQLVSLSMRRDTLLVLLDFLCRSHQEWRKTTTAPQDDCSDESFVLCKPDSGERVALWRLEGEIERTLPEVLSADYRELIATEKRRLSAELYGS